MKIILFSFFFVDSSSGKENLKKDSIYTDYRKFESYENIITIIFFSSEKLFSNVLN